MEVLNAQTASLCNFEVMSHLQNIKEGKRKNKGQLATITYETLRYLESTPSKLQTNEQIQNCLKALKLYNLTKNETLMLVNTPPSTPLEIQLMIEESEERLTEEQVEEILQIIGQHFPHVKKADVEMKEETEDT